MTSALYPLDGPHYPQTVIAATREIEHLVRYLNHATADPTIFTTPAELAQVVGGLHEAIGRSPQQPGGPVAGLFQLFSQLAAIADRWGQTPGLYDYRRTDPKVVASDAGLHLRGAAAASLPLAAQLAAAHGAVSRLGINPSKGTS